METKTGVRIGMSKRVHRSIYQSWMLADWLTHIEKQYWRSIDLSLERVAKVWGNLCGRPSGLVIAVAGTNGKGSCIAMLESVFRYAGLKVGSYTSPHLVKYNERIRVGGEAVSDAELCRAFTKIEYARDNIPLTYFEFGTLCALLVFWQQQVEISLLEVGMGGRLDAVNIIDNDIALITSIGIDHTQWLGTNRDEIAAEKAGIMKPNALAVCADPTPPSCIARIAAEHNCLLVQNGRDYQIEHSDGKITWNGKHPAFMPQWRSIRNLTPPFDDAPQRNNLGGVITTLALTQAKTGVTAQSLEAGLANTQLSARCEQFSGSPEIILDVAHNLDAVDKLANFLIEKTIHEKTTHRKIHGVFGILSDKPSVKVIERLEGVIDHWYFATLAGERGQTAQTLWQQWKLVSAGSSAIACASPSDAYLTAMRTAHARDIVAIFGSFRLIGVIISHLEQAKKIG